MNSQIILLEKISSTQDYAKEHISSFDLSSVTVIAANEQTKGRGRFHRKWNSPKGKNIYATFVFAVPKEMPSIASLTQVMMLTVAQLLEKKGLSPKLKWPNDLFFSGKKCAGALTETSFEKDTVICFLGLGMNINMSAKECAEVDRPATSLFLETHMTWNRHKLLKELQTDFAKNLDLYKEKGFAPFHPLFEKRMLFKGEKITFSDGKKEYQGICHLLDPNGQLQLLLENGEIITVSSGEIV